MAYSLSMLLPNVSMVFLIGVSNGGCKILARLKSVSNLPLDHATINHVGSIIIYHIKYYNFVFNW